MSLPNNISTDILSIINEFHQQVKVEWKSILDYKQKGELWLQDISERFKNEKITLYASQILLSETFHFFNLVGVQKDGIEISNTNDLALIMKGGGIKGLAYVGALEELLKFYNFDWFAGTSAGAITAILLGCGYSVEDLKEILENKNFNEFKDASVLRAICNLLIKGGFYEGFSFRQWMDSLLADKLKTPYEIKLKHLPHRVSVYACRRDRDALIFDSLESKSQDLSASYVARCSMSIPFFFTPQKSEGLNVFDGGVRNNFPVEILLKHNPHTEFIGLYLGKEIFERKKNNQILDLYRIGTESEDPEVLEKYFDKIIIIDPNPIGTFKFKLSGKEKDFLLECGRLGALNFLDKKGQLKKEDFNFNERKNRNEKLRKELIKAKKRRPLIILIGILILMLILFIC